MWWWWRRRGSHSPTDSGHSDAYNRDYKYGSTHGDPRGNFATNLTCTQYGNQEQIDPRDDSVQGCLDGSRVAPTPSPVVIPGMPDFSQ
jgi:hypothetical protein